VSHPRDRPARAYDRRRAEGRQRVPGDRSEVTAVWFLAGAVAQLSGILLGAAELLGAHKRARDHLADAARLRDLEWDPPASGPPPGAQFADGASEDLATLRGALAAAELNRRNVVAALVLLCLGVGLTLVGNLVAL